MLSAKPWKLLSVVRLLLGLFLCLCLLALAFCVYRFMGGAGKVEATIFYPLAVSAAGLLLVALVLIGRPLRPENFERRSIAFMVCFCTGLFIELWVMRFAEAGATDDTSLFNLILSILGVYGAALVLITVLLREERISWSDAFGFSTPPRGRALLLGLLVACVVLPFCWLLQSASAAALNLMAEQFPGFHIKAEEQQIVQVLKTTTSWQYRIYLGLTAILLAPVVEELLFRGILYPTVKQSGYPRLALWGTSMLFALVHQNLATFLPLTFLAVVLTLLYERTNNLLAPITVHSLFNAANFGLLYLQQISAK